MCARKMGWGRWGVIRHVQAITWLLAVCAAVSSGWAGDQKPNIVFIFIDDWAWNGTPIAMDDAMENSRMPVLQMPNLERLAQEGMKFRNAYASPQCSPSRVCVQTGQSSPRNGFTVYLNALGQDYYNIKKSQGFPVISCISDETIDPETITIPEALGSLGYTSAHFGKWHMRGDPGDEGYAAHDGDTNNNPGNTIAGLRRLPPDLSDPKRMFSVTERAIDFMEAQVEAQTPFYLQVSHYAMHAGSECLPETRAKYVTHPLVQAYYKSVNQTASTIARKQDPAVWLGMGEDLDRCIGTILEKLDRLGVADHTYVVLMSDNGYRHSFYPGLTQPMHGKKWWVWQGGIRVPMIVKGPGIAAGSTFHDNVVNYDLLPTFVDWAGGDPTELKEIDGVSLAGYLRGEAASSEFSQRNLYFHYPHNRTSMPHSAIVSGTMKALHFYERPDLPMLFDLSVDEREQHNIAPQQSETHQRLFGALMSYLHAMDARLPKRNPECDLEAYRASGAYATLQEYGPFSGSRSLGRDER